ARCRIHSRACAPGPQHVRVAHLAAPATRRTVGRMSDVTPTSSYVFDLAWRREHDRMRAIEGLFDHGTRRLLADRGITLGGRCLEVGCGAGGVATWMADQVGVAGHVVAIDLETRFVDSSNHPQLELRQESVVDGALEEDYFDLAHARAVIEH